MWFEANKENHLLLSARKTTEQGSLYQVHISKGKVVVNTDVYDKSFAVDKSFGGPHDNGLVSPRNFLRTVKVEDLCVPSV